MEVNPHFCTYYFERCLQFYRLCHKKNTTTQNVIKFLVVGEGLKIICSPYHLFVIILNKFMLTLVHLVVYLDQNKMVLQEAEKNTNVLLPLL